MVSTVEENKVQVMINGREYCMSGDENEAYLFRLGHYVDRKVQEVRRSYHRLNDADAAVMAAITIADELLKLRDENAMMSARLTNALRAKGVDLSILEENDMPASEELEVGKNSEQMIVENKIIPEDFLPKELGKTRSKRLGN